MVRRGLAHWRWHGGHTPGSPENEAGFFLEMARKTVRARFGAFVLDRDARLLLSEGGPVHLTPKADDGRHPSYVRTVHGYGYAFCGNVQGEPAAAPASPSRIAWWLFSDTLQVRVQPGEQVVGREPLADVWLDSASVSRRHARIVFEEPHLWVEDLGSKNGTWVNGHRSDGKVSLASGDEIRFGSVRMQLRRGWEAGSTETLGPA